MRLNDRSVREELRKQAMSVPIPDDMWTNISRELERNAPKVQPQIAAAQARPSSQTMQLRQILAISAAAGIFWMMIIPSSAYVDRLNQPSASPVSAPASAAGAVAGDIPWDIPTEAHLKQRRAESPKSGSDLRRPAHEALIIR